MGLVKKIKAWRQATREDQAAIAMVRKESMRAGDEPRLSMEETADNVAAQFPPPS